MFVIADSTHTHPSYLWKVLPDGTALITMDLSKAPQFLTKQEAKEFLGKVKQTEIFTFNVYELTIKLVK